MNNKVFVGLAILVVGALAGWFALGYTGGTGGAMGQLNKILPKGAVGSPSNKAVSTPAPTVSDTTLLRDETTPTETTKGGVAARTVVTYSSSGFQPAVVTVKVGEMVSFANDSSLQMWIASNSHPKHDILPSFDQKTSVAKGGSYEYTFQDVGTWRYHNHNAPSDQGTVVVTK